LIFCWYDTNSDRGNYDDKWYSTMINACAICYNACAMLFSVIDILLWYTLCREIVMAIK